jgi:hypothetical protein
MRLRLRSLIAAALAAVVLLYGGHTSARQHDSAAVKRSAAGRWYTFTGPEGDFRVDLPGRPLRGEDALGPVTTLRSFELTTDDGMMFTIGLQDAGGDPRSRENNVLLPDFERLTIEQARAEGREVVQTRRLGRSSWEMELRWREPAKGARLNAVIRQTLRRGRLYHLGCASVVDGKDVDRAVCNRFFRSLRFTR